MLHFIKSHIEDLSRFMDVSDVFRKPSFAHPHLTLPVLVLCQNGMHILIQWGRNQMAASLETTFSNAFHWMEMCEFRLKFH